MSLASGPLTAPLARVRGAAEAGSMTRIRYVSRVPGACSNESAERRLVNDDSPTRFLERTTATGAAPLTVGDPSGGETGPQRDHDPDGEGAGPDRRPRLHDRVQISAGSSQRDPHFALAGAGAGPVTA